MHQTIFLFLLSNTALSCISCLFFLLFLQRLSFYLLLPQKSSCLPGARPALGACSAEAEPARRRKRACGESRIAAHGRARLALEELSQSLCLKARTGYQGAISHSPRTFARLCGLRAPAPSAHLPSSCRAPQKPRLPGAQPALGAVRRGGARRAYRG